MNTRLRQLSVTMIALATLLPYSAHAHAAASPQRAQVINVPDTVIQGPNPCTQRESDVTLSDVTLTLREATDGAGHLHIVENFRGTFETDDGFAGRFTQHYVVNDLNLGSFDDFTVTDNITFSGTNNDHQTLLFHGRFHLRVIDGDVVSEIDLQQGRCVGVGPQF